GLIGQGRGPQGTQMTGCNCLGEKLVRRRPNERSCEQQDNQGGSRDGSPPFEPLPPRQRGSVGALGCRSAPVFCTQGGANTFLQMRRSFEIKIRGLERGAQGPNVLVSL